MKIIVVSDTHGDTSFLEVLPRMYPDCHLFLHAGDSELSEEMLSPFISVKGNCDYYITRKALIKEIMGVRIFMIHGDHTLLDLDMLAAYGKNNDANIVIHGHTHIPYYNVCDGVHILCPGSIRYPRVSKATYAVITFTNVFDIKVEIKNYEYK